MKRLLVIALVTLSTIAANAQGLSDAQLKTLEGQWINATSIENGGKPIIISFWATWCKPCLRELHAYMDLYIDWQEETGVKLVAISIDDTRNSAKVAPMVNSEGWEYDVYIDENQDLKRNMGVVNIPHTFVLDGTGKVVWQHAGYTPGDEDHLYDIITKVANGESVENED